MRASWILGLILLSGALWAETPEVMLPKTYDGSQNIQGWLMSEKLDGVRALWDGHKLVTRQGKEIHAPEEFLQRLPPFALDGELWTQRADFENIVSIVRKNQPDQGWQQITYQIFEVPNQPGGLLQRLQVLKDFLQLHNAPKLRVIEQIPVQSRSEVLQALAEVTAKGGEGLVVRDGSQPYQTGRLNSVLKVKAYQDTECKVVQILPGLGKFEGKMGALECEMADGTIIKIGSGFSDAQRNQPPEVDSFVTFKFYGLTEKGNPRFPVFLRVRNEP